MKVEPYVPEAGKAFKDALVLADERIAAGERAAREAADPYIYEKARERLEALQRQDSGEELDPRSKRRLDQYVGTVGEAEKRISDGNPQEDDERFVGAYHDVFGAYIDRQEAQYLAAEQAAKFEEMLDEPAPYTEEDEKYWQELKNNPQRDASQQFDFIQLNKHYGPLEETPAAAIETSEQVVAAPPAEPIALTVAETEGAAVLAEEATPSRGLLDVPTEAVAAPAPAPEATTPVATATPEAPAEALPAYDALMAMPDAEFMAYAYGLNEETGFALLGQLNEEEGRQVIDRYERLFAEDELTPVEEVAPTDLSPTEPAEFASTYDAAQNADPDQVEEERAVAEAAEAEAATALAEDADAAPVTPDMTAILGKVEDGTVLSPEEQAAYDAWRERNQDVITPGEVTAAETPAAAPEAEATPTPEATPVPEAGIATRFRGFLNRAWNGAVNYAQNRLMPVEVRETIDGHQVTHWEAIAGYVLGGTIGGAETILIQEWLPGAALLKGIANAALINGLNYGLREVYRRRREGAEGDTDRLVRLEREHKTAARFLRNAANGMATGVIVAGLTTAVIEAVHPGVFGHAATAGVVEQAPGVEHGTIAEAVRQVPEVGAVAPEGIADNVLHVDPKLGFWDENITSSWFGGAEHFPNQENVARHILTKYWESGHAGQSFPTEALDMRFGSLPIQLQDALTKLYSAKDLAEYVAAKPDIYPQLAEIGITFP